MARTAAIPSRSDRLTTLDARMRVDAKADPVRLVALTRAELGGGPLSADESVSALGTRERAAGEAIALGRLSLEAFAAPPAVPVETAVGEGGPHRANKLGRVSPDRVVGLGVVRAAERDEVRERVRFVVVREQTERLDVMDGDALDALALDALTAVAIERCASLSRPGRTAVSRMSSTPRWIVGSLHARHNVHPIWEVE